MTTHEIIRQEGTPYIEVTIALKRPVEVLDLVSLLSAIVHQFQKHIATSDPELAKHATVFVRDVRHGSIIFELVPYVMTLYQSVDIALTIDAFVKRVREVIDGYSSGRLIPDATKSDLKSFHDVVKAIAKDENGSLRIESAQYYQTKSTKRSEFKFDSSSARPALESIERQQRTIDLPAHEVFQNVLLIFWQSNVADSEAGKRTHEKAIIESISKKPLAVVYETEMAKERIKHETAHGDRNIYKLGFYVDCYVERVRGKPVAYKIAAVRDIIEIELPDEP
jgi:hypothetical protein